jgi:hypothetical protein
MAGNRRMPRDKATTALSTLLATISRRRPLARAAGVAREELGLSTHGAVWLASKQGSHSPPPAASCRRTQYSPRPR